MAAAQHIHRPHWPNVRSVPRQLARIIVGAALATVPAACVVNADAGLGADGATTAGSTTLPTSVQGASTPDATQPAAATDQTWLSDDGIVTMQYPDHWNIDESPPYATYARFWWGDMIQDTDRLLRIVHTTEDLSLAEFQANTADWAKENDFELVENEITTGAMDQEILATTASQLGGDADDPTRLFISQVAIKIDGGIVYTVYSATSSIWLENHDQVFAYASTIQVVG